MRKMGFMALTVFCFSTMAAESSFHQIDKKCSPNALSGSQPTGKTQLPKETVDEARDFIIYTTLNGAGERIPYRLSRFDKEYNEYEDLRKPHPETARLHTHQTDCLRAAIEEKIGPYAKKDKLVAELQAYRQHLFEQERAGWSEGVNKCKKESTPNSRDVCWTDHFSQRLHSISMRKVVLESLRDILERNKFGNDTSVADIFRQRKDVYLAESGTPNHQPNVSARQFADRGDADAAQ